MRKNISKEEHMKLKDMFGSWVGTQIRDRTDQKYGEIVDYDEEQNTVTIKFFDGEIRTIPHHRDPHKHQPDGAFYTNRYWDGPTKK